MKYKAALKILTNNGGGYMVHFEKIEGSMLRGDYFPDKHAGEKLIPTEAEAWALAEEFAKATRGKMVNIYVVDSEFSPVKGYDLKKITNR